MVLRAFAYPQKARSSVTTARPQVRCKRLRCNPFSDWYMKRKKGTGSWK